MTQLTCAVCLRLDDDPPGVVVTIANGHALCLRHFRRLADWETTDASGPSLHRLARYITDPFPLPPNA